MGADDRTTRRWLANGRQTDPYLDLISAASCGAGLTARFGEWWRCPWDQLTEFVLSRFVIRQHIAMAYAKTSRGERCLLQVDGGRRSPPSRSL